MNRKMALLLAAVLTVTLVGGCAGKAKNSAGSTIDEVTTSNEYPIDTDVVLTYNVRLDSVQAEVLSSLNESEFAKELTKRTGIRVEFQHPTVGQEHESFNLMIASKDWPDIFETNWYNNPGGPSQAFADGIILPLNDIISKVSPNMQKLLNADSTLIRDIAIDGNIYCYPSYREGNLGATYYGAMARKDLLDKAGLTAPETIDEWESALAAFKDKVKYPLYLRLDPSFLSSSSNLLVGAYGVGAAFYVEDNKVKYGPLEDGYRQWVAKMAEWYKKGYINTDFSGIDSNSLSSNFVNGQVGIVAGSIGSDFGTWLPILRANVSGSELIPLKYPVLKKGDRPMFGQKSRSTSGYGASISTQCKNVEIAARLLDYGYSEEGRRFYALGTEGVTYEMKDGAPHYLPLVSDSVNQTGKSMSQTLANYSRIVSSAPYYGTEENNKAHFADYYAEPIQMAAAQTWADTDAEKHVLPMLPTTKGESDRLSELRSELFTYVDENTVNLINGITPLDNYDSFVEGIKRMGVEEILDIYQKAYDKYMQN